MTVLHAILRALGCEAEQVLQPVDVARVLDEKAAHGDQSLDWRHSVVDLMKLIGVDSSEQARMKMAEELGFRGEPGSVYMNQWLHQQLMHKIMDHGGLVPLELL